MSTKEEQALARIENRLDHIIGDRERRRKEIEAKESFWIVVVFFAAFGSIFWPVLLRVLELLWGKA